MDYRGQRNFKAIAATLLMLLFYVAGVLVLDGDARAGAKVLNLSDGERVGRIVVVQGSSQTLRVSLPFSEIMVGDPETADVNALTNKTIYVLGKKLGLTNVTMFDENKRMVAVIDIEVTHNLSGMRQALQGAMPGSNIKVHSLNGRVLLEGMVPSAPAAEKAMAIAKDFAGGDVTNSMAIAANQQVNLEVRFVEVSRQAGKEFGINWNLSGGGNGLGVSTGAGVATGLAGIGAGGGVSVGAVAGSVVGSLAAPVLPFGTILANVLGNGANPDVLITALEQKNLARRLAEPNLTTLSGVVASFHAGGEVPVQDCQGTGANRSCSTVYKPFGVQLQFTPVVLDNGLINLNIKPEVSEIDEALSSNGNFSFINRNADTSVELRDGQSFAIAGLLQTVNAKTASQIPWLGDLPILGTLFRSQSFQKKESDLVIIVTPRLARPVGNRQELHDPLQNPLSSNDPEFFLLGQQEVSRKTLDQTYHGKYGHIIDLPQVNYGNPQK